MNINFELYRIFYVVANNGNITKASKELMISQPAISKAIKNLEESLGGELFVRTKRGVVLTNEGREFYTYIKKAMEYIYSAENRFTDLINLEVGIIKIGISSTLTKEFLLPYLKIFHKKYPKIDIKIFTDTGEILKTKLKNGLIDMIILNFSSETDNEFKYIKCEKIHDCFIANKDYEYLKNKKISLKELNNYPLILQTKKSNTRDFIDSICEKNNIVLKPNLELASYSLVVEFVKTGLGIGMAKREYIANYIKNDELFILDIKEEIPFRYVGIALSKHHLPSFSVNRLIDIINANL